MIDLNDLYYFHAVVTHQSFSAAAQQIGVPKGTLSRRIAKLEDRLGVRLLERSTRRLRTTDIGREVFAQSQALIASAEAVEAEAAQVQTEPSGTVRVSCPPGLIQDLIADLLPPFLKLFPRVRVQVKVMDRPAGLIEDHLDVALRAGSKPGEDSELIVRHLARSRMILAISPALQAGSAEPLTIDRLSDFPSLSMTGDGNNDAWELEGPGGETRLIHHQPRLFCSNVDVLRAAAIEGVGAALLPEHICLPCFRSGQLAPLLPEWYAAQGTIDAVFLSRKGMLPSVRAFIDFMAHEMPKKAHPFDSWAAQPSAPRPVRPGFDHGGIVLRAVGRNTSIGTVSGSPEGSPPPSPDGGDRAPGGQRIPPAAVGTVLAQGTSRNPWRTGTKARGDALPSARPPEGRTG